MYRIAILEKDTAYLERLIFFLKEHHGESFEINAMSSLDDLDMDIMQCSALFFGDDVAVDDALFPADIIIGYLTEQEETDEQYINKYQSMEQIYRRMMELCEKGNESAVETEDTADYQKPKYDAETVTVDGETYRVYHIAEELVDRLAVKMLAGNHIKGLPQAVYHDGSLKVRITGMESLYDYVCENNTLKGKGRLIAFLADMADTACSLEEYMLSMDRLMLDPREIYVDRITGKVLIPYIPVLSSETRDAAQFLDEIREWCSVLLEGIDSHKDVLEPEQVWREEDAKVPEKEAIPFIVRKRTGEKVPIDNELFKLGKDASYVDYCIKDNPAVSRNHADIVKKPDGYYLIDRGSLNHTFVNGRKLAAGEYRKLEDGCLLQLANEVFEFGLK